MKYWKQVLWAVSVVLLFGIVAYATAPYSSHTAEETAVDSAITNETTAGAITPSDVGAAIKSTAAMIDAISRTTSTGTVTYHAPSDRTDADAWFEELETILETATDGDTFCLPAVLFQPSDADVIDIAADDITIIGNGCSIKRGTNTPISSTAHYLFSTTVNGQRLRVVNVIFEGNGDALEATYPTGDGNTVYTRSEATFVDCVFNDPLITGECYSLRHIPSKDSADGLTLINCTFNDSGYACFRALQGRVTVIGGHFNILSDRNGAGTGDPQQRFFQVDANAGYHPMEAYFEGARFYCAAPDVSNPNMGYFNFGGDEMDDVTAGVDGPVTDTGVEQTINSGDLTRQPDDRTDGTYTASDGAPCRLTVTSGGTAADIGDITVTVNGTDRYGTAISEEFDLAENEARTYIGEKYFKTVSSWVIPAHDNTGATTSLGWISPRIQKVVMRDCSFMYVGMDMGSSGGQWTKMESIDSLLWEGVTITHLADTDGDDVQLSLDNENALCVFKNCTLPGYFNIIGGETERLVIDGCRVGIDNKGDRGNAIENAERAKHIEIKNSRFGGMNAYIIDNDTASPWSDYDAEGTITMENVEYLFADDNVGGSNDNFVLKYVPRIGFFAGQNLRDLYAASTENNITGAHLADSADERFMASVLPGDRRTVMFGWRLDAPTDRVFLEASPVANEHSMKFVGDDPGDPFPAITAGAGECVEGDRIVSVYNGVSDKDGAPDSDSGVLSWVMVGTTWVPESKKNDYITQAVTGVGTTVDPDATTVYLDPDGNYNLTSNPQISDGVQGQTIMITVPNGEANTVTFDDGDGLQLGASRTVGDLDVLTLLYNGTDWVEVNFQAN